MQHCGNCLEKVQHIASTYRVAAHVGNILQFAEYTQCRQIDRFKHRSLGAAGILSNQSQVSFILSLRLDFVQLSP